jgi:hypothetical protein
MDRGLAILVSPLLLLRTSLTLRCALSNLIFLSAASIRKCLERFPAEEAVELPVVGKVVINLKELQFRSDRISLPIHHKIPLVPDFEIDFEKFECQGTKLSFEIGRVGIIPGCGVHLLCQALAGFISRKLGGSSIQFEGNRISVEVATFLPNKLQDIKITQLKVLDGSDAGVRIEFEF